MSGAVLAGPMEKTTTSRIVLASMVGTAIEFYDFYIYGTALRSCSASCSSRRPTAAPSR